MPADPSAVPGAEEAIVTDTLVDRVMRRQGWLEPVADAIRTAIGRAFGAFVAPLRGPATFRKPTFAVEGRDGGVFVEPGPPVSSEGEWVGRGTGAGR